MPQINITFPNGSKTEVLVENGALGRLYKSLKTSNSKKLLISTSNTKKHLQKNLKQFASLAPIVEVPEGELCKSLNEVEKIYSICISNKLEKNSTLIAVGGGSVGDLAGFVATTYKRGINLIVVPTTLLSQVDCLMTKVGINFINLKNVIAAFCHPSSVVIDPPLIYSLDESRFASGFAEIIKYGMIGYKDLISDIEKISNSNIREKQNRIKLSKLIYRCCKYKSEFAREDPYDKKGVQIFLGYGHTLANAIEMSLDYTHGEAVSIGMVCAAKISYRLGYLDKKVVDLHITLLKQKGLPIALPKESDINEILAYLAHDKKTENNVCNFILLKDIGKPFLHNVPLHVIYEVLNGLSI